MKGSMKKKYAVKKQKRAVWQGAWNDSEREMREAK